jgi:hypothetical protein
MNRACKKLTFLREVEQTQAEMRRRWQWHSSKWGHCPTSNKHAMQRGRLDALASP